MPKKTNLQVIQGGRAALEIEGLRAIATDFQKFLDISRSLAPAANGQLKLATAPELDKPSEETDPNRPPEGNVIKLSVLRAN